MVVHVLVQGLPICGFSRELPCNWPMGHKWVRSEEYLEASCWVCKRLIRETLLVQPEVPPPPPTQPDSSSSDDDDDDWYYGIGWI